jgi:hypothetical protein
MQLSGGLFSLCLLFYNVNNCSRPVIPCWGPTNRHNSYFRDEEVKVLVPTVMSTSMTKTTAPIPPLAVEEEGSCALLP